MAVLSILLAVVVIAVLAVALIEVRRGLRPIRLARLSNAPFTDRLVAKFDLSVAGWRGNGTPAGGRP